METIEELKGHLTLPELLDHLGIDFEDLEDDVLLRVLEGREEDMRDLLEEVQ